jgi:hypothetical protein
VRVVGDVPQPERPDDEPTPPEWLGPPKNVMGGMVPLAEVVLRTEHAFVGLQAVTAYPTGLTLHLVQAGRRAALSQDQWQWLRESFLPIHRRDESPGEGAVRGGAG